MLEVLDAPITKCKWNAGCSFFTSYTPRSRWAKNRIVDGHRDGKRLVVRSDEKLTAFMELELPIRIELTTRKLLLPSVIKCGRA